MKSLTQTTFGKRLKLLRDAVGATQEQMAKVLNVSRSTYSYYELGESSPPLDKLRNIMLILGRDKANYLLGIGDRKEERPEEGYSYALPIRDGGPEEPEEDILPWELQDIPFRALSKDEQQFLLWFRILDNEQRESLFHMLVELKYPSEPPKDK